MQCPKCKANLVTRSHRRGLIEYGISVFGYYPYSCDDCHQRFLISRNAPVENFLVGRPSKEREIKATRDAMNAKRKRRELLLYGTAIVLFLTFLYYITREHGGSVQGLSAPALSPVENSAPIRTALCIWPEFHGLKKG